MLEIPYDATASGHLQTALSKARQSIVLVRVSPTTRASDQTPAYIIGQVPELRISRNPPGQRKWRKLQGARFVQPRLHIRIDVF